MRIAIDAMGGDHAPGAIVAGTLDAVGLIETDQLVLYGDERLIREHMGNGVENSTKVQIVHAPDIVAMDDSPVEALRRKPKSSIALMAKAAKLGEVDAVISAGNTGACVAAFQMRMRLLPGVQRPGILVVFPTFAGPMVMCDVGANIAPKPIHLYQYAVMGCVYCREILKIAHPTVGLVSIGQEDAKGNELVRKVNHLFREDQQIEFVGNIEGREFLNRPADVVVCDGFVGNVILKLTEGIAEGLFKLVGREIARQKPEMLAYFEPIVKQVYAQHDYNEYGGAPLIGVDGMCMICHGSSDGRAIKNAILAARKLIQSGINAKIAEELQRMAFVDENT